MATQADVDAIDAAIANPNARVRQADREVQSRPIDELLKARAVEANSVAAATGRTVTRQLRVRSSDGW